MLNIYIIYYNNHVYIGGTTITLENVFIYHIRQYYRWKNNKTQYLSLYDIFDNFGFNKCQIKLLESSDIYSIDLLNKLKSKYIRNYMCSDYICVNKKIFLKI
jgi:hypothetical protein